MNKTHPFIIVCLFFLVGCATVQMPELSQSHPAHPEAQATGVSEWPSILKLPEEPVVAPPLPIRPDGRDATPSRDDHRDHLTIGIDVGNAMYVCPMHEEIRSDSPDSCSECGMDLVKKGGA